MKLSLSALGQRQRPSDISRLMTTALECPDLLSLAAGFTDNATLPLDEVRVIVDGFAKEEVDSRKTILQYGTNQGRLDLRRELTQRIEESDSLSSGILDASRMLITNGSQQQLYVAMQTLCDPGDIVLVEQPTYFVFLEMLEGLGIEARPMPMQANGDVNVDGLETLVDTMRADGEYDRLKAVYLVSYYANPSGHSISSDAKRGIAKALSKAGGEIALIEDAAYRELYFEEPHESPGILGLEEAASLSLLYTSTLTKPFASGLKVGFGYCTNPEWFASMLSVKGQQDFGTSHFAQAIVEKAIVSGVYDRHLSTLRSMYSSKMDCLDCALGNDLRGLGWNWDRPQGGLYLWVQSPDEMDTGFESAFHSRCIDEGVMYVPGDLCHANKTPKDFTRLSFGVLEEALLVQAADRFTSAASRSR